MTAPRQTNLYNPAFRVPRELVTLPRLALAAGLLLIGTLGAAAWMSWQLGERQSRISGLTRQVETLQARLQVERPARAAREKRAAEELASLQRQEEVLRRILEAAGGLDAAASAEDHRPSHSEVLAAVARASLPGLWLTRVDLSPRADAMTLRGHMLEASLLPRYIARLNAERSLAGLRFDQLEVRTTPWSGGAQEILGFALQAAPASVAAEGETP